MAADLTSAPSSPAYHRDSNFLTLQTDQVDLIPGTVHLDISAGGPSLTETLLIEWGAKSLTLTVAATTNAQATAWPTKGAETLAEYADRILEALRQNDDLTTDFYIWRGGTVGAAERVTLRQIVPGELTIAVTNGLTDVDEAVTSGTNPYLQDNLSAYLQVFLTDSVDPNGDTRLVSLHAPYEVDTAEADFDLKDLLNLEPALPGAGSIDPVSFSPWPHDVAYGAFQHYYLRYADKYGVPAVAEALTKSSTYYMLHGSRPGDKLPAGTFTNARLQHGYARADGGTFYKPVSLEQPDWVYLWVNVALTGVRIELERTWSDGTVTSEDTPSALFDLDAKTLYWFASGPLQHASTLEPPSPSLTLVYYSWRLLADAGAGEVLITQVRYRIRCACHPWNLYVLMDNGLAGCESVLLRGRTKWKYDCDRDTARRLPWTGHSATIGDLITYNAEAQHTMEVSTGWQDKYYIEHLRQLLLGQLWLIDVANARFLKIVCDTKSLEIKADDQELFSLSLTLRAAWLDSNWNQ